MLRIFLLLGGTSKQNLYRRKYNDLKATKLPRFKVARYSFSGSIPPTFEHKLRRHKQRFGKIATTVVSDKDENLL